MSNNNNNRQAIPIDTPSRFVPRFNKLKALMTNIQQSTEEFKSATQQEMAKKDAQIQNMSTQMHEMALQMHALKKESDGLKTMAKKVMASTFIGRAPGKIARHAIRRAMKTAEVRALRDIQWDIDSSLMKNEENMKIASSIVAQLAVHPKVSEVAASLKWGPAQKRKYLVEVVRSRFNNLERKAEDVLRKRRVAFSKNVDDCVEKFGPHAECERLLCSDMTSNQEDVIENNEELTKHQGSYKKDLDPSTSWYLDLNGIIMHCTLFFNYLDECRRSKKKMGQLGTAKKTRLEFGDVEATLSVKNFSLGVLEKTFLGSRNQFLC
ncbi:hypothetical protein EDC96DRAFT_549812 [Choanephora cucurbitarum]|nr:hypothetical protein EDC96DRAFT_549812 [Choanephora cucurbitarum]